VRDADPDAIVHQGTALADARFGRNFDGTFAQTNRLRTEGTDNLLAAANDGLIEPVRKRQLPIVGDGDDEPAPEREWLPVLAEALGARPPRHVPVWLARLIAGEFAVMMGTDARAASKAKAKRELGWTPRYPDLANRLLHCVRVKCAGSRTSLSSRRERTRRHRRVQALRFDALRSRDVPSSASRSWSPSNATQREGAQ
jgi:hypothetical protein